MTCHFEPKHPWRQIKFDELKVYVAGDIENLPLLLECLNQKNINFEALKTHLCAEPIQFGLMVEGEDFIFAANDRISSYPVFYGATSPHISNHAQHIAAPLDQSSYAPDRILEFAMSGYVLGQKTLHKEVMQLQGGEWIYINKTAGKKGIERYYRYQPDPKPVSSEGLYEQFDSILNTAIQRTIKMANGAPIWVPLSGGLDSRLILAKLHEHQYPNLHSFSYGAPGNFEAKRAQKIAAALKVPWHMIPAQPKKAKALYNSATRRDYEEFSHGYSRIPSYVEFETINRLKNENIAPNNAIIVNGQTGDFISGGHIPPVKTPDALLDFTIKKHFALWTSLQTQNTTQTLKSSIRNLWINTDQNIETNDQIMRLSESFEWQERQCKVVVQGQRTYDFFKYRWALPLWDADIMDFFEILPRPLKYSQKFFKDYLQHYNYQGLFDALSAKPQNWKYHQYWILPVGWFLKLIGLNTHKEHFYKSMLYYGFAHHQWALFGRKIHKQYYKEIRNMISLCVQDFLKSHNLPFPQKDNAKQ